MALPQDFRVVVVNNTGIAIDAGLIEVDLQRYRGDGGSLAYTAEDSGTTGVSAGGESTVVSVSSNTDVGLNGNANGNLSTNGTTGPSGDLEFYIERSTDGGTSYERDPVPIAVLSYSSLADKSVTFTV